MVNNSFNLSTDMFFITFGLLILSLLTAPEDQRKIEVKPGQDVTLQCRGPRDASVVLLEWIRSDLKSHGYVFAHQNGRQHENLQLPSFRGRVELRDPEMKNGDFSVVLKNVNVEDTGTYECRVVIVTRSETTYSEVRHLIDLKVTHSAGNTAARGFVEDLLLVLFLVVLCCGLPALCVLICSKRKRKGHRRKQTADQVFHHQDDQNVSDVFCPDD